MVRRFVPGLVKQQRTMCYFVAILAGGVYNKSSAFHLDNFDQDN